MSLASEARTWNWVEKTGSLDGAIMYGVPLEVMGLELADGDLLVIHAMRLRPKYRDAFERVMEWHKP